MGRLNAEGPAGLDARTALWFGAALVFSLPLIASLLSSEMNWSFADFALFGAMVFGVCAMYELGMYISSNRAYRLGFALTLFGMFVLVFVNLAVGIIGSEDNPANLAFFGIPLVGVTGALLSRFSARGLARTLSVMAISQVSAAFLAPASDLMLMALVTGVFTTLWLAAAQAFRVAARNSLTV